MRGSPADVHTHEGLSWGYEVSRHCPRWSLYPQVVVVMSKGTKDFPPKPPVGERNFWAFAFALRNAAAVSSIHSVGTGWGCSDPSHGYSVTLVLHDYGQVDDAIRNVGSWLVAHDLKGDVVIWPTPIGGPPVPL